MILTTSPSNGARDWPTRIHSGTTIGLVDDYFRREILLGFHQTDPLDQSQRDCRTRNAREFKVNGICEIESSPLQRTLSMKRSKALTPGQFANHLASWKIS
jgi:hypothetical protein